MCVDNSRHLSIFVAVSYTNNIFHFLKLFYYE